MTSAIIYAVVDTSSYGSPAFALYTNREAAKAHLAAALADAPQMKSAYAVEERPLRSVFDPGAESNG